MANSALAPDLKPKRSAGYPAAGFVVLCLFAAMGPVYIAGTYLFQSHRVIVTVLENDATTVCQRPMELRPSRYDALGEAPRRPTLTRNGCGAILTSHGAFELPRTYLLDIVDTPRETLDLALVAGCEVEITVVGPGGRPAKDATVEGATRQRISRIHDSSCQSPLP